MAVKMKENENKVEECELKPEQRDLHAKYLSLFMQCVVTLTISLSISLYMPFYPDIAEKKNASSAQYGFVLGSNCLTAFLVTPVIGRNVEKIGIHFAYIAGICINGVCCFLTGFLDEVPSGITFLSLSVAIRVVNAVGNAGVITASFCLLAIDFPNSLSFVFAINRFVMNIGQLFGPALGGALHELGGFRLPFVAFGVAQIVAAVISIAFLPNCEMSESDSESKEKSLTIWKVFKIPSIYIAFTVFVVSTMASGFISISLTPQILHQFHLNKFHLGLAFGIKDGAGSFLTPVWGYICNKPKAVKPCIIISCLIMVIAFVILAPFPGIEIKESIWLVCVAQSLYGAGIAGLQVGGVIDAFHEVTDHGYRDDAATYGFVAGLWTSFSGLGRFVSRSFGGILIDVIGFQKSTLFIIGLLLFVVLITSIYLCVNACRSKPKPILLANYKDERPRTISTTDVRSNKLLTSCEFHRSRNFVDAL